MTIKVGNPSRKLVLIKLADNASDSGECWPSHQHIADHCEISRRSVITHIEKLCEMGLVTVEHRTSKKGNASCIYTLHLDNQVGENISPTETPVSEKNAGSGCKIFTVVSEKFSPPLNQSLEPVKESNTPLPPEGGTVAKVDPLLVNLPDWLPASAWADWIDYRKAIKKSLKPASLPALFSKLEKWHLAGHNLETIISTSIANGWQGLFEPKGNAASNPAPNWNNTDWIDGIEELL